MKIHDVLKYGRFTCQSPEMAQEVFATVDEQVIDKWNRRNPANEMYLRTWIKGNDFWVYGDEWAVEYAEAILEGFES